MIAELANSKKRIVIVSDSCALPREELSYTSTYPYLLRNVLSDCEVINTSTRANTITNVTKKFNDYYRFYNPDIIIVHLGIVDCFPRPYPNNFFFNNLKRFLKIFRFDLDKFLKKTKLYYTFGDWFDFALVSKKNYENGFLKLAEDINMNTNVSKVIILGIIKPSKILLRSKIFPRKVKEYNTILRNISNNKNFLYLNMDMLDETYTIWDGFHLNEKACDHICSELEKIINTSNA